MAVRIVILMLMVFLSGCVDQIITITSNPTDAAVYVNRDRLGNTPLIISKDDLMPMWSYNTNFTRAVITLKKEGFEDYVLKVNELYIPETIHANLLPKPGKGLRNSGNASGAGESAAGRLAALQQQLDSGAISEAEYEARKKEIVAGN
jgi:hypothetical protein